MKHQYKFEDDSAYEEWIRQQKVRVAPGLDLIMTPERTGQSHPQTDAPQTAGSPELANPQGSHTQPLEGSENELDRLFGKASLN